MSNKLSRDLCEAFCNEISVREVPVGLAVSTPFRRSDGDAVSFYVVQDSLIPGLARLEDDGETMPYLEACGVDFDTQTRMRALQQLLSEHNAEYDETEATIRTPNMVQDKIPQAALHFVALLLRLADFLLLREEHVESTFKEDAAKRIREQVGNRAIIREGEAVSRHLSEIIPDMVLQAADRDPVAIFFSQSSPRVYEAIILQMDALYVAREPLSVIALLEAENSISRDMQKKASNRLAAVTFWRDDEIASVQRIEREVVGLKNIPH